MNDTGTAAETVDVGELILISAKVLFNILVQFLIGIIIAYKGIVNGADVSSFSKLMNLILVPAVTFGSIASRLTLQSFVSEGWIISIIGVFACYEFAALGLLLRPLVQAEEDFKRLFVVAMALPNAIPLPIAICSTLCMLGVFDDEYTSISDCNADTNLYVFMYNAFNSLSIWIVFYHYLRGGKQGASLEIGTGEKGATIKSGPIQTTRKVTSAEAVQDAVELEIADKDRESANTQSSIRKVEPRNSGNSAIYWLTKIGSFIIFLVYEILYRPPVLASFTGLIVGLIQPVQSVLFSPGAPLEPAGIAILTLGAAAVPIINLVMAFSIGLKMKEFPNWKAIFGSKEVGAKPRTLVSTVLLRGIILPGIHFALLCLIFPYLPGNRLLRMVLIATSICPTASLVVVLTHVAELPELAKTAAFVVTPQYIFSIPTVALFLSLGLYVTS